MLGLKRITGAADLASAGKPGSWIDDAARERFMAAYERAFALWPQPRAEFDVETATTTTWVHAYRPHPAGDAVVLLTGAGFNASRAANLNQPALKLVPSRTHKCRHDGVAPC